MAGTRIEKSALHLLDRGVQTVNFTPQGGRFTDDGDFALLSAWADSRGRWGGAFQATNQSVIRHSFWIEVEFGHMTGPNQLVVYYRGVLPKATPAAGHNEHASAAGGSGEAELAPIRDNFPLISAVRMWYYQESS